MILSQIEKDLSSFYGFSPSAQVINHLVTKFELISSFGDGIIKNPEFTSKGGVWFFENLDDDETFIGVHFDPSLKKNLSDCDPLKSLGEQNLDSFCILVEEISHFHMLINRMTQNQNISKLELEWQGEIDKALVCGLFLYRQCGDDHMLPLVRKIFDEAKLTGGHEQLYYQANRLAAKFWFDLISDFGDSASFLRSKKLRDILKKNYYSISSDILGQLEPIDIRTAS